MKPDYINPNPKPVSKERLLAVLKEMSEKHEADRREMQRSTAEALRSGFYCTGGRSDIKPLI
jgi:hypothetical protein